MQTSTINTNPVHAPFFFRAAALIALLLAGYVSTKWTLLLFKGLGQTPEEQLDYLLLGIVFEIFKYVALHIGFKKWRADKKQEGAIYAMTGIILVIISFGATVGLQKYTQAKNAEVAVDNSPAVLRLQQSYNSIAKSIQSKQESVDYYKRIEYHKQAEKVEATILPLRKQLEKVDSQIKLEKSKIDGDKKTTMGSLISELAWWLNQDKEKTAAYVKISIAGLAEWLAFLSLLVVTDKKPGSRNLSQQIGTLFQRKVKSRERYLCAKGENTMSDYLSDSQFGNANNDDKGNQKSQSDHGLGGYRERSQKAQNLHSETSSERFPGKVKNEKGDLSGKVSVTPETSKVKSASKQKKVGKVIKETIRKNAIAVNVEQVRTPEERYQIAKLAVFNNDVKITNEALRKKYKVHHATAKAWLERMEEERVIVFTNRKWKLTGDWV